MAEVARTARATQRVSARNMRLMLFILRAAAGPGKLAVANYLMALARRWRTASANCSSTATVASQPMQASVTLCP